MKTSKAQNQNERKTPTDLQIQVFCSVVAALTSDVTKGEVIQVDMPEPDVICIKKLSKSE